MTTNYEATRRLTVVLAVVGLLGGFALQAMAQVSTGSVAGTVTDPSGAVVAGARVTLRDLSTGFAQASTTSTAGSYEFSKLRPATYELTAEAAGFSRVLRTNVPVSVGSITRVDLPLHVGAAEQTVEVREEIPLVEPDRVNVSHAVDPQQIAALPMLQRNVLNLALTTPGALQQAPGTQAGGLTVAGMRAQSNNFTLDGTSLNDPQVNGPLNGFNMTDSIQEFNVQTSIATADVGRNPGAQVQIITKSGTNAYHGTLFYYGRNDILDANDYFLARALQKKNVLRRHQFGGTMGGFLRHDKTFWFGQVEAVKQINPLPQTARVPTDAERAKVTDPVSKALLKFFPSPNTALVGGTNWAGSVPQVNNNETYLLRVDNNFGPNHRMMARAAVNLGRSNTLQQNPFNGNITNWPSSHNYVVTDIANTTRWVNELRLGFTRNHTFFQAADRSINPATIFVDASGNPLPGYVDTRTDPKGDLNGGLPRITVSDFSNFGLGAGTNMPQGRATNTFAVIDNVTYIFGRHKFQFGGEVRREYTHRFLNGNFRGAISFATFLPPASGTDNSFASGKPLTGSLRTGGLDQTFRNWSKNAYYLYFMDTFKPKENLTLSAGLRYEFPGELVDAKNRGSNFVPGVGMVALGSNQLITIDPTKQGRDAIVLVPTSVNLPANGMLDTPKLQFAPFMGITYAPRFAKWLFGDDRTVIRTGFRLGYDEVFANIPVNMGLNGPQVLTTSLPTGVYSWATALSQKRSLFSADPTVPGGQRGIVTFNAWDTTGRNAYGMNYALEVERQVGKTFVLDVNYVGSQGRKLGIFIDPNQPFVTTVDPTKRGSSAPNVRNFPFVQYAGIGLGTFAGSSNYNALVTSVRMRPWHGITSNASYTWGRSMDFNSNFFGSDRDFGSPANTRNIKAEYGRSDFDVRHRMVYAYILELPFGRGHAFGSSVPGVVNQVIGGWQVSGITSWQTGFPFTVSANTALDFSGFNQFIDRGTLKNPATQLKVNQNSVNAFDPTLFAAPLPSPGPNNIGGTRRTAFPGPNFFNQDFAILKNFPIRERQQVQFRAELFNAFNMVRFNLPIARQSLGSFGTYTSAQPPRNIQLALRFEW